MISFISGNGTSRQSLVETRIRAATALQDALVAFRQTAPHGRDYVGAEDQYDVDRRAFEAEALSLRKLVDAMTDEAYALTQIPGRP